MDDNKKLNIGVIVCNLESEYANELCTGMDAAACELGHNLVLFSGMMMDEYYNYSNKNEYDYQYNTVYDIVPMSGMDVVVVSLGTTSGCINGNDGTPRDFLRQFGSTPVLLLEGKLEGYNSITIGNKMGIDRCMEHLIEDHGYRKIGFVAGPKDNGDSAEREEAYLSCMEKYGLEVKASMIERGCFTSYSQEPTGKLLDNNPGIEAVVFGNDAMAAGGYREIRSRGLIVGRDIAVTGLDDSAGSKTMDPPLTTVKVHTYNLGYNAVYEAERIYEDKEPVVKTINVELVRRSSCGCDRGQSLTVDFDALDAASESFISDAAEVMTSGSLVKPDNVKTGLELYGVMVPLIRCVCSIHAGARETDSECVMNYLREIMSDRYRSNISVDSFQSGINDFIKRIMTGSANKDRLMLLLNDINMFITHRCSSCMREEIAALKHNAWISANITRDALIHDNYDALVFSDIEEKMVQLGIDSGYIYFYSEPAVLRGCHQWEKPEKIQLICCHHGKEIQTFEDTVIPVNTMFRNRYIDERKRHTMAVFSLFMNDEQHGFFVSECGINKFHDAYFASLQLGSAVKYIHLIKKKNSIQKKLRETNMLLREQSISDELTSVLNRRGFLAKVRKCMESNPGAGAAMFFCDVDNLKMINDVFGHAEGDFAITSVAEILKNSVRGEDIIGRVGGDEFTVMAVSENSEKTMEIIKERIAHHCSRINEISDKPYKVEVSVGAVTFVCGEDADINRVMSDADTKLYNVKKNKKKSIFG